MPRSSSSPAVAGDRRGDQVAVVVGEVAREAAHGAEVEQRHPFVLGLVQVVPEVRVGLHEAELEQLAKHQAQELLADRVAQALRVLGRAQVLDRQRAHAIAREHAPGREVRVHARHEHARILADERAVLLLAARLARVVGLAAQLFLQLGEHRVEIQPRGYEPQRAQRAVRGCRRRRRCCARRQGTGASGRGRARRDSAPRAPGRSKRRRAARSRTRRSGSSSRGRARARAPGEPAPRA